MNIHQLEAGDLIFSFSSNNEAEHIALYAGIKDDVPYVVHAISKPQNALMLTRLIEADYNCYYQVMRPCNVDLALQAKQILLTWVEHLVPFASVKKRNAIIDVIENMGGIDNPAKSGPIQEQHGKKTYEMNYSQYLLMANHLPFIPVMMTPENTIEGLRCTEAIIAAFNIALLMLHASKKEDEWVIEHVDMGDFIRTLSNPLPFDAKATLPQGVYKHCIDTPTHWEDHGRLAAHSIPEADQNSKADWREFNAFLKEVAHENTVRFLESPKGVPHCEDHNKHHMLVIRPESPLSPPKTPTQRSDGEGSPIAGLRGSPIYSKFFTFHQPVALPLEDQNNKPVNRP